MKLSAPVYQLKRKARLLSRREGIPLCEALRRVAVQEGFGRWSLLAARVSATPPTGKLFAQLRPGDCVVVAGRPGQGKTLMSLELAAEAMKLGNRSVFFTLEYTEKHVLECFRTLGVERTRFGELFEVDSSDAISANYIVRRLASASSGTLVVIDYLQLLDQRRENPELTAQVRTLKSFAREKGWIVVFLSQIDRSYDPLTKPCPDMKDIRLPNPLDLKLFSKACFLHNGQVQFRAVN